MRLFETGSTIAYHNGHQLQIAVVYYPQFREGSNYSAVIYQDGLVVCHITEGTLEEILDDLEYNRYIYRNELTWFDYVANPEVGTDADIFATDYIPPILPLKNGYYFQCLPSVLIAGNELVPAQYHIVSSDRKTIVGWTSSIDVLLSLT